MEGEIMQSNLWGDENAITSPNGAIIDPSGIYRYSLWRVWDEKRPRILWIMLNPSTADENQDDNTLRRCINFSKRWGYGSLEIVNLFAFRATHPVDLIRATQRGIDRVGPENNDYIEKAIDQAQTIVVAWGNIGSTMGDRDLEVLNYLRRKEREIFCLDTTIQGCPKHPLFVPADNLLYHF